MGLDLLLMVAAVVCFGIAAAGIPAKINLVALGLGLWALTAIV